MAILKKIINPKRCFLCLTILTFQSIAFCQGGAKRPNILFAIMDDASWKHMGAYGCTWVNTPAFDKIAQQGLLFMNAYTPNAKCAPSRSVILTGRYSWQLEEAANHWPDFPKKFKVFPEVLNENGYHVGFTGKGWAPGIAKNADGSARELLIKAYNDIRIKAPTSGIGTIDYSENFKAFLKEKNQNEPFFFWYGGYEPHRGYEYKSGSLKGGRSINEIPDKDLFGFWPDTDSIKEDLLDYGYEIEYFDKHLGKILQVISEAGELENTIVVVTSDNGMPFPRVKGQEYEFSNHLPLAIMWPKGITRPGRVIRDNVSFVDFAPSFLDLAGCGNIAASGMQTMQGQSIRSLFSDKTLPGYIKRNEILLGKERHDVGRPHDQGYPIRGIIKDGWLYLHNFNPERWPAGNPETGYLNTDGSPTKTAILDRVFSSDEKQFHLWELSFGKRPAEELYHFSEDPDCMFNLAYEKSYKEKKDSLHKILFDSLKKQGDPRMFGKGDLFDHYIYTDQRSVNFYKRYMSGEKPASGWVNDTDFQRLDKLKKANQPFKEVR